MSQVINAIKDFNTNFRRVLSYVGQVDVDVEDGTDYKELDGFNSLSKEEKAFLAEGQKIDEPIDYKKILEDDNKKIKAKKVKSDEIKKDTKSKNDKSKNEKNRKDDGLEISE